MAAIEAEKLNFTYPDADRAALSDVTFSIPSGGFYLLMGPSGSGCKGRSRLTVLCAGSCTVTARQVLFFKIHRTVWLQTVCSGNWPSRRSTPGWMALPWRGGWGSVLHSSIWSR